MSKQNRTQIQDNIIDGLPSPAHGFLKLAPRVGKSRIAIRVIKNEKSKSILWVTPNVKLRDIDIPLEFDVWNAKRYLKKTLIICYGSLSGVKGHFDKVIFDEYQDITEANSLPFFSGQITYGSITAMSGTHPKHKEKLDIYKKLGLKALASIDIDEGVELKLIADYQINVIEVRMNNTDKSITAGTKAKPFMTTEKSQYDYLSKVAMAAIYQQRKDVKFRILARMRAVYNSLSKQEAAKYLLDNLKGRKLVFCGGIAQAESLCDNTYHSKTNDVKLKQFLNQEIDKIAMVNAGGVGFTYENVQHFIIVQANSDKKGETTQKLARSLLKQKDYKATIWFLCLLDTQDEKWVQLALQNFDKSKIKYVRYENLINQSEII